MGVDLRLTPWAEYAVAQYSRRLPDAPEGDGAAGMDVGGGGNGGGVAANGAHAANGRRAAKRPRTALEADGGEQQQPQQRSCAIM